MVILRRLSLNNFLSHENSILTFEENAKILFDGISGSGKSSLFEAVVWALYGEGRSSNASLVRSGCKKAVVTLGLSEKKEGQENDDEITLERAVTSGGKHSLSVTINGIAHPLTGVRDLQAWIEKDLMGASYLLFINSAVYMQGNMESFVMQNAARRKEILLEIVRAENYDKLYDRASDMIKDSMTRTAVTDKQIDIYSASVVALEAKVKQKDVYGATISRGDVRLIELSSTQSTLKEKITEAHNHEKKVLELQVTLKDAETGERDAQQKYDDFKKKAADVALLEIRIQETPDHTETIAQKIVELNTVRTLIEQGMKRAEEQNKMLLTKPVFNRAQALHDLTNIEKRLHSAQEILAQSPSCPSGNACPYVGKFKEDTVSVEKQRDEHVKFFAENELRVATWQRAYDTAFPVGSTPTFGSTGILENELSVLQKLQDDRTRLIETLTVIKVASAAPNDLGSLLLFAKQKVEVVRQMMGEAVVKWNTTNIKETEQSLVGVDKEINSLQFSMAEAKPMITVITGDEERLRIERESLALLGLESSSLSSTVEKLQIAKEAFGSKGIKTVVVDYILPKLEQKINEVLHQLSEFTVRLDTLAEKADGEGNKEGLFINIINEMGQELPYEAFSGGEKLKITVAISEALASLTKQIGFRIMDETIVGLNSEMIEDFVAVLEKLQASYPQVLMISHLQEIKDLFENQLFINKRNGISYVTEQGN